MSEQQHASFEIDMDFTEVQAWDGEQRPLVPPGDYDVVITAFEEKPASTGTPMINVTFEVTTEGEHKGSKLWGNYALTEKAKGRLKSLMVACGTSLNKIVSDEFLGAPLTVTVIHNDVAGKIDQNGVPGQTRTFANVMGERPIATAAATPAAKPPVTRGPAAQNAKPANGAARRA